MWEIIVYILDGLKSVIWIIKKNILKLWFLFIMVVVYSNFLENYIIFLFYHFIFSVEYYLKIFWVNVNFIFANLVIFFLPSFLNAIRKKTNI